MYLTMKSCIVTGRFWEVDAIEALEVEFTGVSKSKLEMSQSDAKKVIGWEMSKMEMQSFNLSPRVPRIQYRSQQ